jgi:hypothetical protein
MVDAAKLKDLITRVEAATGPDREIDMLLADHLGIVAEAFSAQGFRFDSDKVDFGVPFFRDPGACGGGGFAWVAPAYTASIDAALALVDRAHPGWRYHIYSAEVFDAKRPFVRLMQPGWSRLSREQQPFGEGRAEAETLPLAILAALLRSIEGGERG